MSQRVILISGCSSGIGLDAARTLRGRGWRVFASCRAEADCAELRAQGFESPRLDQADETSVNAAFDEVLAATDGRLDAVYANGAYMIPSAVEDISRDAMRAIFETNLFGVLQMAQRALPVMRAQGHGRIVLCSSVLGLVAMRYRGPYVATKFAMEGLFDTLRLELHDAPWARAIHVSILEPGPIVTPIRANARLQFERWIDWEGSAWRAQYETFLRPRLCAADDQKPSFTNLPAAAVTRRLIHAVEARRPRPRYFITPPTWLAETARRLLPTRLRDALFRKS
jgi:NAD(P)-dependent dehydrogenase (short-subunit alcohol dehydrogenase family)